ncbi:hypothetical protein [Lacticaseibacillus sp. 53-4]|uniref:hypothetical protein n=1 Tax=Lacticaseibacillus sp. 53-4 TaxID=2799575 RepID=UPI00194246CE|nr:hypothetical protein [Lacticaseibacillus sp. 53-4]
MDRIIQALQFISAAVGTIAGSYAVVKLGLYGIAYMTKNRQKVEEAKDGLTNVAIGLFIAISAGAIVAWLKTV